MIDQKTLDQLVTNISNALPDGIKVLKADLENNLRAVLEASLRNMNLVSREEFDVQAALLSRTIDKLKQLEQQLAEMENSR
jgi:BMFP domain-containing protein YqiC